MKVSHFRSLVPGAPGTTGLALCGGGVTGAFFEAGVLAALDEILGSPVANSFAAYVGASAGSSVAAAVSQGVPAERLYRALADPADDFFPLGRRQVFEVPVRRWLSVALAVFLAALRARIRRALRRPLSGEEIADWLPAGLFEIDRYRRFFADFLARAGLSQRFEDVPRLFIAANDVDSGERVVFGDPARADVDIPLAIAASSAIPLFFEPVRIGERYYFDGAIGRVSHADVLVRRGARRLLVLNPVVPIRNDPARVCIPSRRGNCSHVTDKGMLAVADQAYRITNKVRLHLGLKRLVSETPGLEIVLVEPGDEETVLFVSGSMSFAARQAVLEYARTSARRAFQEASAELSRLFLPAAAEPGRT